MKKNHDRVIGACFLIVAFSLFACTNKSKAPSPALISSLNLKQGDVVSCGSSDKQFGFVEFAVSGNNSIKEEFQLALKLLHSFEYDEAEKVFARIIKEQPDCAMAYWGVAMSNFHPLWSPPTEAELEKGSKAIAIAQSLQQKTKKEEAYIQAIASFYQNWKTVDHKTRCRRFEKEMESLYLSYPNDKEAAIFYALALNAAADPTDKTYSRQKKAGTILTGLYPDNPNHPGIVHYLIHTYDAPELATLALPAARSYASVAPSSAHALHMPSHIFTRLGFWDECIQSNLQSVSAAQCYAQATGIKGHWDEELHGMDYLVYAYLQKGNNREAKKQWEYLSAMQAVSPMNFKVAYAYAAIPSRYLLENKLWKAAANLEVSAPGLEWGKHPWQKAIIHFTRLMGMVNSGHTAAAREELNRLNALREELKKQKDDYKADQVTIQIKAGEAWILFREGKKEASLKWMKEAADMEDKTEKHPVTPGEVLPARELLGDLLLQMNDPALALEAYEANLKKHPNRLNGLYGAKLAAEQAGQKDKAAFYISQISTILSGQQGAQSGSAKVEQFFKNRK